MKELDIMFQTKNSWWS